MHVLEEVLQTGPSGLQKLRSKFRYDTFRWQWRHGSLRVGKCLKEVIPQVIKFGVSLSNAHRPTLHCSVSVLVQDTGGTYLQSLDVNVPYNERAYACLIASYDHMILDVYAPCPTRFVLSILITGIVL